MPRPRTYCKEQALEKATLVFWQKGYHDTSMDELVQATGMSRYSFYEIFGGKKQLFVAVLEYYFNTTSAPMLTMLNNKDASLETIEHVFAHIRDYASSEEGKNGCLLCNTAIEMAPQDEDIAKQMDGYRKKIINGFAAVIKRAQAKKEIKSSCSPNDIAVQFFTLMQGTMVASKAPGGTKYAKQAIDTTLALIRA